MTAVPPDEPSEPGALRHEFGADEEKFIESAGLGPAHACVDFLNDVRPRETEEIVVTLEIVRVGLEPVAPKIALLELVGLNHRAHRAIEHDNLGGEEPAERICFRQGISGQLRRGHA